jgi:CysZ protein
MKGFSVGISGFFKAISFIFKHNLWWTFFVPVILTILLFAGGHSLLDYLTDPINSYIQNWIGDGKVTGILSWIVNFLINIIFFFIFAYFSGYIVLIILSPLLSWVSEQTDKIINNTDYPFSWKNFTSDIWRGIVLALRNMLYETGITVLVLLATLIPGLNIITGLPATIFLFIISSYFYGFSYMDYALERRRMNVKERVLFVRKNKGMAIANGSLFSISLFIPFVGVLFSGITAIIATVGAVLALNNTKELMAYNEN